MDGIKELMEVNFSQFIIWGFVILIAVLAGLDIIGRVSEYINKPVKWVRNRKVDHDLLIATSQALNELKEKQEKDIEQSIKNDEIIRNDLSVLKKMFIDKQIDDMRFEILDFASAISLGRNYSKEQFDHVIVIDKKYQRILEENGLENGQVTASMEVIMDVYKEKLRTGF